MKLFDGKRTVHKAGQVCALAVLMLGLGPAWTARGAQARTNDVACTLIGTVVPGKVVLVCPKVAGPVVKLLVEPGSVVKAGDLLAELDATRYRLELERLRARMDVAKAQLQEAKGGTASPARVALAEAELKAAEAELRLGEYALGATQIRAPIDGTILNRQADLGQVVDPGHSVTLYEMADLHNLAVLVNVPEAMRDYLFPSQSCRIRRQGSEAFHEGKVLRLYPAADPNTGTYPVQVKFDEKGEPLRPGCMVTVEFLAR